MWPKSIKKTDKPSKYTVNKKVISNTMDTKLITNKDFVFFFVVLCKFHLLPNQKHFNILQFK